MVGRQPDAMAAHAPLGDTPYLQFVRSAPHNRFDDARFLVALLGHLPTMTAAIPGWRPHCKGCCCACSRQRGKRVGASGRHCRQRAVRHTLAPFAWHTGGHWRRRRSPIGLVCVGPREAERWLRAGNVTRTLPLVLAGWPQEADDTRLRDAAAAAPGARLHLVIAGWPPPPLDTGDFRRCRTPPDPAPACPGG